VGATRRRGDGWVVREPSRIRPGGSGRTGVSPMSQLIGRLVARDEDGQGLAEYALILALIAIVAIVALIFLGDAIADILSKVGNSV
jgi:pilus assembly protein Flp/PilA